MKFISLLFTAVLFIGASFTLTAQEAALPAKNVVVYMEAQGDIELDPTAAAEADPEAMLQNQSFNGKVIITLFSDEGVAKIHVKLGNTPGADDIAGHVFEFDQLSTVPFTFERDGETVVLGMGQFNGLTTYHAEVIMEDEAGQLSEPKYFSSAEN